MASYTLTTSPQMVGRIRLSESGAGNDRTFQVLAYYSKTGAKTANVYVQLYFEIGSGSISGSGKVKINGGTNQSFSFSRKSTFTATPFQLTYNSSGQCLNNTLTVALNSMSARWSDGTDFDADPLNSVSTTFDLPNIDPEPTVYSKTLTIQSGGFRNGTSIAVASITTLRFRATVTYAKTATLTVTGAGITNTYSLSVTKASSETITKDFVVNPSTDDYQITATLNISNDTGNASGSSTFNVKGYHLPTYGSATYTARCLQDGTPDSQGAYGRMYLTWNVATILASNPNKLQSYTVKLNGTQITATSGSIADGYLNFIFPLAVNVQGNLSVYLADEVYNNTITSLVVPKSIMPLSLYQSGDSVGVSVGRMATSDGFWCYEEFYLKQSGGTKVFNVAIDGSGNMTITDVSGTLSMNYVSGDTI